MRKSINYKDLVQKLFASEISQQYLNQISFKKCTKAFMVSWNKMLKSNTWSLTQSLHTKKEAETNFLKGLHTQTKLKNVQKNKQEAYKNG